MSLRSFITAARADPARVREEIDDEFSHHIEAIERELLAAGHTPAEAAALARRRFGDIKHLTERCERILFKEHDMAKRIHLAITVLLAVLLTASIVLTWSMVTRARRSEEIARMHAMEAVEARMMAEQALQKAVKSDTEARDAAAPKDR